MINRLKLLYRLIKLSGRAREIELEWQKIQQDEHNFEFVFKTFLNEDSQSRYLYKKGVADGVKWALNRFS